MNDGIEYRIGSLGLGVDRVETKPMNVRSYIYVSTASATVQCGQSPYEDLERECNVLLEME